MKESKKVLSCTGIFSYLLSAITKCSKFGDEVHTHWLRTHRQTLTIVTEGTVDQYYLWTSVIELELRLLQLLHEPEQKSKRVGGKKKQINK